MAIFAFNIDCMRLFPFLILLFVGFPLFSSASEIKPTITGRVVDQDQNPIPYAAVALMKANEKSVLSGVTTNENGVFSLSAEPGVYDLSIQFLSYKPKTIQAIQLTKSGVNLGDISLEPNVELLEEVEIQGSRNTMEFKLDKRVFNVGENLNSIGANAAEILDNVPSVSVDVEGNVSLRGSENVRILIDGKPSGLVGISSTDALRQMQGDMIERIEVITNPSARYDAEGEVGILNIVLKKNRKKGTHGGVELSTGYPDNHRVSVNLNHRRKWTNMFISYGAGYRNNPGNGYSINEFTDDNSLIYERFREHSRGGWSHNMRLGSEFFLNDKNTLTLAGNARLSNGNNSSLIRYVDSFRNEEIQNITVRREKELEDQLNIEGELNYFKQFEQKGREWNTAIKYFESDDTEKGSLTETGWFSSDTLFQRTNNTEDERNFLFQSDYIHPIGEKGKLEAGVKRMERRIENHYLVEVQDSNAVYQVLPDFNNEFDFAELISAAYTMYGNEFGKVSLQAGVRWEYSDIEANLLDGPSNKYIYNNLFPSAHFSYKVDSLNSVQLSYSRRISRPRFRHLLPFFSLSDNRNFFSGNPNLRPEFTDSYEMGYLAYLPKGNALISGYYRRTTGVIEWVGVSDSTGFTRRFPTNLSTENAFGIEVNGNYNFSKKLNVNANFNFFRAITEGSLDGQDLNSDTYTWTSKGTVRYKFNKTTEAQLSFNYRAPRITTQGRRKSMYFMDVSFSKELIKDKATLTLSGRDLFNTRMRRSITETADYYSESAFQWRSRQILLSFKYFINPEMNKGKRKAKSLNSSSGGGDGEF